MAKNKANKVKTVQATANKVTGPIGPMELSRFIKILTCNEKEIPNNMQPKYYKLRWEFRNEIIAFIDNANIKSFSKFIKNIQSGYFSSAAVVQEILKTALEDNYNALSEKKKNEYAVYALSELFCGATASAYAMTNFVQTYLHEKKFENFPMALGESGKGKAIHL